MPRGKFVAFEVGDEFAIPPDDRGMQGMDEESLVGDEVHTEQITYTLNIGSGTGEEAPVFCVGFPRFCVITEGFRLIVDRVEGSPNSPKCISTWLEPMKADRIGEPRRRKEKYVTSREVSARILAIGAQSANGKKEPSFLSRFTDIT